METKDNTYIFFIAGLVCFWVSRHNSLKAEFFNNSTFFQVSFFFFFSCELKDTFDQSFALYYSISVQK